MATGDDFIGDDFIGDKEIMERDLGRISGVDGRKLESGEPASKSILSKVTTCYFSLTMRV